MGNHSIYRLGHFFAGSAVCALLFSAQGCQELAQNNGDGSGANLGANLASQASIQAPKGGVIIYKATESVQCDPLADNLQAALLELSTNAIEVLDGDIGKFNDAFAVSECGAPVGNYYFMRVKSFEVNGGFLANWEVLEDTSRITGKAKRLVQDLQ